MATTATSWTGGGMTAGNWTEAANWSNGVPAANYEVTINATSDAIETNMPDGSIDYASFFVGPNFKGNLATSGDPAVVSVSNTTDVSSPTLRYASGGTDSYINAGASGIDVLKVLHSGPGTLNLAGSGALPDVQVDSSAGQVVCSGTSTFTLVRHDGGNQLTFTSNPTITTAVLSGPTVSATDIGTGYVNGTLTMTGNAKFSTKGWILPRGTYIKNSNGTDAEVEVLRDGRFTPQGSLQGDYTVTVMVEHDGSRVTRSVPGAEGTFGGSSLTVGASKR